MSRVLLALTGGRKGVPCMGKYVNFAGFSAGRLLALMIFVLASGSFLESAYDLSYGLHDIALGFSRITLFYTHLITLMTALVFAAAFANWSRFSKANVVGHIFVSLAILFAHYWIFAGWENFVGSPWRSKIVHGFIPVLVLVFWICFADKRELTWRSPLAWTAFAITYTIYALIRGAISGEYAYDVGNVDHLGYLKVFGLIGLTTLLSVLLGYALLFLSRATARLYQAVELSHAEIAQS